MLEHMNDRGRPGDPRLLMAVVFGTAWHHAGWEKPTEEETAAAVVELQALVDGRADALEVLCEAAGVISGFHEGDPEEPRARHAAYFLLRAGAEQAPRRVAEWIEIGRKRAFDASRPPFGSRTV